MTEKLTHRPLSLQNYTSELQPRILSLLRASFGEKWGDDAFWRWKHSARPGFSPCDVAVAVDAEATIACFHLVRRSLRLGPGLEIPSSIEGDFAIAQEARGTGLLQRAYVHVAQGLVSQSVVLRGGFSSPELIERVYKRRFGHRVMPTVTAQYRKILSDRALAAKLEHFGEAARSRPWLQRLLKRQPLTIRMEVGSFQPCDLVLTHDSCTCSMQLAQHPDLSVRIPYVLLAALRTRSLQGMLMSFRAFVSGQVRVAGIARILARYL